MRAHPTDIMAEVFRALRELGINWKKAAQYNVKCRWAAPFVEHSAHGGGSGDAHMVLGSSPPQADGQPPTAPDGLEGAADARLIKFEIQVRMSVGTGARRKPYVRSDVKEALYPRIRRRRFVCVLIWETSLDGYCSC